MNKLKTKQCGATLCVFAVVDNEIMVHLANLNTYTNRIYTTRDGYNLICDENFKKNHSLKFYDENFLKNADYVKFDACDDFREAEQNQVFKMLNRELAF